MKKIIAGSFAAVLTAGMVIAAPKSKVAADGTVFGDDYSLNTILTKYDFFVEGDLTGTGHTVGGFVVGGKLNIGQGVGSASVAPSYAGTIEGMHGEANREDLLTNQKANFDLYVSDSSYDEHKEEMGHWAGTHNVTSDFQPGKFINASAAWSAVRSESAALAKSGDTSNIKRDGNALTIDLSDYYSATIDGKPSDFSSIKLEGVQPTDFKKNKYVISFLGNDCSTDFLNIFIGNAPLGNSAQSCLLPGENREANDNGFYLIWNFPNATSGNLNFHLGHIVAPNADVVLTGGSSVYN